MDLAHVDRLIHRLATASAVARMLAHAACRGRKRIVENDGEEGFFEAIFFEELQEPRNIHVQRAAILAGRKGEFFTDSGSATVAHDVIFELIAEVAKRGQYGIGCRLSEPTKRAIANVAAQFVENIEMVRIRGALGNAVQNAQTFVQSYAARDAFA